MRFLFAFLTAGLLLLGSGALRASDNNDGGNAAGGGGRDSLETVMREYIDLRLLDRSGERIDHLFVTKLRARRQESQESSEGRLSTSPRQVLIDAKFVEVTDVNKLDLSGVPLFGSFVGPEFNGDDLQQDSKVGNVFRTENGGLFVMLQPTALGDPGSLNLSRLIVFNDDFSHEVKPLRMTFDPPAAQIEQSLGSLAPLPSVRSVTTQMAVPDGGSLLLGGLTLETAGNDKDKVPFLGDIPVLNRLFAGTAHQKGQSTLLIMIKPTILIQED